MKFTQIPYGLFEKKITILLKPDLKDFGSFQLIHYNIKVLLQHIFTHTYYIYYN